MVSYILAVLVTLRNFVESGVISDSAIALCAVLVIYPHVVYWISRRYFNSGRAARNNLSVDSLLVGLLVVTNEFHIFASASFISALVLSSLMIARPVTMVLNALILGIVVLMGWMLDSGIDRGGSLFTDSVCGLSIITYGCMVAYSGFKTTSELVHSRRLVRQTNQQLEEITDRLRRYVSPQIYSIMGAKPQIHNTVRKHLTVFFSDIEGFTEIMDNLEEEMVTVILNEYLNSMTEIAIEHGGTIDKFMGDGIMVFFGDPRSRGDRQDALACVQMALEMRRRLKSLRGKWQRSGIFSDLHIRIGINSGYCAVGNFGSESRMDYTAVGSNVNIASRLEGKAKRDSILISSNTYKLVSERMECHKQQPVTVKGIRRPIENYLAVRERTKPKPEAIELETDGFHVSLNPMIVDAEEARRILARIEDALHEADRKEASPPEVTARLPS